MTVIPPPPPGRGHPRAMTPEVLARIEQATRAGAHAAETADFAGIHLSTLMKWQSRGRREAQRRAEGHRPIPREDAFVDFARGMTEWRAMAKVGALGVIQSIMYDAEAADTDRLRAATWYLEHSDPENWGRRTVDVNATVKHEFVTQLDDEIEALAARHAEQAAIERRAPVIDVTPSGNGAHGNGAHG